VRRNVKTNMNIISAVLYQMVAALVGLVLPRFVLESYGSAANGLMQSIGQILNYTTLLEFGVGGVVLASLYLPLAQKNTTEVSRIFCRVSGYFRRICYVFVGFAIVFSMLAGVIISSEFDFAYVAWMVLIMALGTFMSYYYALPHYMLLRADQKLFIIQFAQTIAAVVNLGVCLAAIRMGLSVHMMKLMSVFTAMITPVVLRLYVKYKYQIVQVEGAEKEEIPAKRDGMIHYFAYFIHRNTDVVILSVVHGVALVSVYSIYNAVLLLLENLLLSISNGFSGAVGNMLANREEEALHRCFRRHEYLNTTLTMGFCTVCAVLILPFVSIYTGGIEDVEYIRPLFAGVLLCSGMVYCLRIPYENVIAAAGHYQQTKVGAMIEVALNLGISLLLVKPFGLVGVALGTLLAMTYRTVYSVWYLSHNILYRPMWRFAVSVLRSLVIGGLLIAAIHFWMPVQAQTLVELIVQAVKVSVVVFPAFAVAELLFGGLRKAGWKTKTE